MGLIGDAHQGELARGINYDALSKNIAEAGLATATSTLAQADTATAATTSGQIPGQLDLLTGQEV
jgi:hypothetical protein